MTGRLIVTQVYMLFKTIFGNISAISWHEILIKHIKNKQT
jgi:hypothetical protein